MAQIRWPDGVVRCPRCDSEKVTYLANARVWKCYEKHERPKFSLKVGTVFEDSPRPLQKWLPALWLLVNCKNGISSYELGRALKVTQKTAWFMLSRLRLALQAPGGGKISGSARSRKRQRGFFEIQGLTLPESGRYAIEIDVGDIQPKTAWFALKRRPQ